MVQPRRISADVGHTLATTAQFTRLESDEAAQILRWRLSTLTAAGYDLDDAVVIASHVEIDLQAAALVGAAARRRRLCGSWSRSRRPGLRRAGTRSSSTRCRGSGR